MSAPLIDFSRFYRYDDLCQYMESLATWKPDWAALSHIGISRGGRRIPLLTITNPATGPAADKPVFLVHGNIHACELSGSSCSLYLAHHLLTQYGEDPLVTRLLDRIAFHIIPRVSTDGAEQVLTEEHLVRSAEHPRKRKNCIWPEDLNGDGRIHRMRVPDPNGPWFAPDDEPRMLVPRLPGDTGGKRYRLSVEGLIHDWDGGDWSDLSADRYDFNRNWAMNWKPLHEQFGAGRYPFSEPETRAVADHIFDTANTFGMMGLHTGTQAILRPPTSGPDSAIGNADLIVYRQLADLGARITGFAPLAVTEYRKPVQRTQPHSGLLHGVGLLALRRVRHGD